MKTYKGKINRFLFKGNDGFGIAIFILFDNPKKSVVIKGIISLMQNEVVYQIEGEEVEDLKRKQLIFNVSLFKQVKIFDQKGLVKYLSSPLFPTVGKKLAEKIIDKFKKNIFEKILENKEVLLEIEGMSQEKANIIYDVIYTNFSDQNLLNIFVQNNLKIEFLNNLQRELKDNNLIEEVLKNSFYQYAYDQKLFPFGEVDKIALHFGVEQEGQMRVSWKAHEIVKDILFSTGHTFTTLRDLLNKLRFEFSLTEKDIEANLIYAKEQKILYFKNKRIYTKESFEDEQYIANELTSLQKRSSYVEENIDFDNLLIEVEAFIESRLSLQNFKYNIEQVEAIKNSVYNDISIITGGPGTGKTTVITGIVKMYELIFKDENFAITAPTGRAAGKIKEDSGYKTSTIHRLLQYTGNDFFEVNETKPIFKNLVVIDECSMIDNHLFACLLKGVKGIRKFVLVGDVEQLPSVSYGNLFEDLINCETFKTTKLIQNNRQLKLSDNNNNSIIELASAVRDEKISDFEFSKKSQNVEFIFTENMQDLLKKFKRKYNSLNPSSFEDQLTNIQVIAPMYKEDLGISNLNKTIQNSVNPLKQNKFKRYDYEFRINDKVMYTENDPVFELSNGDVGYINEFVYAGKKLKSAFLIFNGRKIEMGSSAFNKVTLSYACSIHKTQGSEYKTVFIILDDTNKATSFFVDKKMLYTAITRAKEKLIILSNKKTFINACLKQAKSRETTLKHFITVTMDS